jgi:hypothetical protein
MRILDPDATFTLIDDDLQSMMGSLLVDHLSHLVSEKIRRGKL